MTRAPLDRRPPPPRASASRGGARPRSGRPTRSRGARWLRLAAWAAVLALVPLTASYWLSRSFWLADVVNLVRLPVLSLAVAVAILALASRAVLASLCAVALLAANAYLAVKPRLDGPGSLIASATRPTVKVATFDVVSDASLADFEKWLADKKQQPDIIGLQNLTNPWRTRLGQITDLYPYRAGVLHHGEGVKEEIVSKFPILSARVFRPTGGRTAVQATVDVNGTEVQVFVIDPNKATGQARWEERNQYLGLVSQWIASQGQAGPTVVLGDWNITPWSPFYEDFLQSTRLTRAGWNWLPPATHNQSSLPGLSLSDDHIVVSSKVRVKACSPGPDLSSVHLPLVCAIQPL